MSLALRLGKTLAELRQSLTASELLMWIEYDRISPIGDIRGDIQAAQISAAVFNSQGAKTGIDDVLLQWLPTDIDDQRDPFEALEAALMEASR